MNRLTLYVALAATLGTGASMAHADSFTYHGSLQDAGKAANGNYDLQLTLYSSQTGGSRLAGPVTLYGVAVRDGHFSTAVDFGTSFKPTSTSYLDVQVKNSAESGDFAALDNRAAVASPDGGCPATWALDGNAAIPADSYLGTADDTTVVIKANASMVADFQPNGSVGLAFPYAHSGAYSIAAGYYASTAHNGSIVFTDADSSSRNGAVVDSAPNQFIVAANGGVGINTVASLGGAALADDVTIADRENSGTVRLTLLDQLYDYSWTFWTGGSALYLEYTAAGVDRVPASFANDGTATGLNDATPNSGKALVVGTDGTNGNGAYLTHGGTWTNASSRALKDDFASVDVGGVLDRLVALPVQTWFYKQSHDEGSHMGPVAEDFAQAFGLGNDSTHVGTVDESGVAFAAIQGLNRKVEAENAALKQENVALRSQLDAIADRLDKLDGQRGE